MTIEEFKADNVDVLIDDKNDLVKLSFTNEAADMRDVIIRRVQLQSALSSLQKSVPTTQAIPIDPGSLRAGMSFELQRLEVEKRRTGDATVTAHLRLQDGRLVTLPLLLPPRMVASTIAELSRNSDSPD
jgi:hypothetical protein